MKRLIAAIVLAFASIAQAEAPKEPANVAEFRKSFLASVAERGGNADKCHVDFVDVFEGHPVVAVHCSFMPLICMAALHPTEPTFILDSVECIPNPGFVPEANS